METVNQGPAGLEEEIEFLSRQSSRHYLYPRPDLSPLERFLKRENSPYRKLAERLDSASESAEKQRELTSNCTVEYNITNGTSTSFGPSAVDLNRFSGTETPTDPTIVFLRGFLSPEWLKAVGKKYNVSPELYRRHLETGAFASRIRDYYSSPLPSSSTRVFQLTIPTICTRNVGAPGYEPEDLEEDRRAASDTMDKYLSQLQTKAAVSDSVVRDCLLFSRQNYVLEQRVSLEIGYTTNAWRAIVWLDSGEDLSRSETGPWSPLEGTRPWETYFLPVIVYQDADSSSSDIGREPAKSANPGKHTTGRVGARQADEWVAAQNICLLPFQYGSRLHSALAVTDALYALSEVFQFAAAAEGQFLNLMQHHIEHEVSFVGGRNVARYQPISLVNLRYIKKHLTAHSHYLAGVIHVLEKQGSLGWPQSASNHPILDRSSALLLSDFEYLLRSAQMLARECEQGMVALAQSSALDESRRSVDMARKVQRLTVIATVFIPLSFICSVWGMNFKELGSGAQPYWMWFVSGVPVVIFSVAIYHWDAIVKQYRRRRKGRTVRD